MSFCFRRSTTKEVAWVRARTYPSLQWQIRGERSIYCFSWKISLTFFGIFWVRLFTGPGGLRRYCYAVLSLFFYFINYVFLWIKSYFMYNKHASRLEEKKKGGNNSKYLCIVYHIHCTANIVYSALSSW